MTVYSIFFSGRRTGIVVNANSRSEAISKARKKKRRGGNEVEATRTLKGTELKQARAGKWVRNGPNNEKPGYKGRRGFGPKPKS